MLKQDGTVKICLLFTVLSASAWPALCQDCLQAADSNRQIPFRDISQDGDAPRLPSGTQAIITSYQFQCCGNVTAWQTYVEPANRVYTIHFQVWRPMPIFNLCRYSLVGENIFTRISPSSNGLISETPMPTNILSFQQGDVVGYYTLVEGSDEESDDEDEEEEDGDGGAEGIQLDTSFVQERVGYFRSESVPTRALCGFNVEFTNAGPVLSLDLSTTSCTSLPVTPSTSLQPSSTLSPFFIEPSVSQPSSPQPTAAGVPVSTPSLLSTPSGTPEFPSALVPSPVGLENSSVILVLVVCVVALFLLVILVSLFIVVCMLKKKAQKGKEREVIALGYSSSTNSNTVGLLKSDGSSSIFDSRPLLPLNARGHYEFSTSEESSHSLDNALYYDESSKATHDHDYSTVGPYTGKKDAIVPLPRYEEHQFHGNYEVQEESDAMNTYNRLEFFVEDKIYWEPATTTSDLYAQLSSKKYREIDRKQIKIEEKIGSGQFGEVYRALWTVSGSQTVQLAVKLNSSKRDVVKLLREAAIMGQFSHHNVIKLCGVVTVGEPMMICSELLANGDLRSYLQEVNTSGVLSKNMKETQIMFLKFARDIAAGMDYLSGKSFVHRDLAARNVLLDESLTCKIGDFGMARDLMDNAYYTSSGGQIPVKWTAPEALLYKKYSPDSDVWSYGMVLFEMWSIAKKPFSTLTNAQVLERIQTGFCQAPPPGCPRAIYELMVECWNPDHEKRPSFKEIHSHHLQQSSTRLLYWSPKDNSLSPSVGVLGAPLQEAFKLHLDLQEKYKET